MRSILTKEELIAETNANLPPCTVTLGNARIIDVDFEAEKVTIEFTNTDEHTHSGHIVQGGFVAGMIDNAMSMAVIMILKREYTPATLELKVSYYKSASQGINRAVGWIVKRGRSVAFLEGELYNEAGELLAKATSTARLLPMPGGKM